MITVSKLKKYAVNIRVLYVEDDKDIQEEIRDFLSRFFPSITLATDGLNGIANYKKSNFDIVITDINMPRMNGIDMIREIKSTNEEQNIIVTSAYNDSKYLSELIDLGVDKFVLKPFNNKKFLVVLYKMCEALYNKKQQQFFEKRMKEKILETETVIDIIEHGIMIIQNNEITQTNQEFLDISGYETFELFSDSPSAEKSDEISSLFDKRKGCISVNSDKEFIEFLKSKDNELNKVVMKKNLAKNVYLLKHKQINDEDKFIVSFTDITLTEELANINPRTELPNIHSITSDIEHRLRTKSTYVLDLISIGNIEKIIKWHGRRTPIVIDEAMAELLKKEKRKDDNKSMFFGYYDTNKFILIRDKNKNKNVASIIGKINELTISVNDKKSKSENSDIFYKAIHKPIVVMGHENIDDLLKVIKDSFDDMLI